MIAWYNRIVWGALGLCAAAIFCVGLFQEPLEGDLTRTGGYSERRFGWHGEQDYFRDGFLFRIGKRVSDLDSPYDVIVIGDSFTFRSGHSWASYLADITGWRIIAFHHRDIALKEIITSPEYRRNPPALVVYQTVERWAVKRLSELRELPALDMPDVARQHSTTIAPQHNPVETRARRTEFDGINERLSVAVHQSRIRIREAFAGTRHAREMALEAGAPKLFSSREQASALLLAGDQRLRNSWMSRMSRAHAGHARARAVIRRHGTEFVVLVFPDKLTVYADYFEDPRWRDTSFIPAIAEAHPVPRLDLAFARAVEAGAVDLYPPNNTHTSSVANRMAAETLLQHLIEQIESGQRVMELRNPAGVAAIHPAEL